MSGEFPERPGGLLSGFSAGSTVAGYRLEEQVGAGGMAVVFRAVDDRLGRRVALKILAPALASDEAFRHRFIRESRAAAAVDDPHIIPVHEGQRAGMIPVSRRELAEWVDHPDPSVVLAVSQVFRQDFSASHGAGCLDDRGIPVRELEPLARVQCCHQDRAGDVLNLEAAE